MNLGLIIYEKYEQIKVTHCFNKTEQVIRF
jgi:hypothetical protein